MCEGAVVPIADRRSLHEAGGSRNREHVAGVFVMKALTRSEARQTLSTVLPLAQREEVVIGRGDGSTSSLRAKRRAFRSPFDVPGVSTRATTSTIRDAVRESRER